MSLNNEINKSELRTTAWITLIGFIMSIFMIVSTFAMEEEAISIDTPQDAADVTTTIIENSADVILFITFDTFFLIGYSGLFLGLYLLVKDEQELLSKIALGFGLSTAIFDIFENALVFALAKGIREGWTPDPSIFVLLWLFAFVIDIFSYAAAVFFGLAMMQTYPRSDIKNTVGILLLVYSAIGFLAFQYSIFMLIRGLYFIIGLGIMDYILFKESRD